MRVIWTNQDRRDRIRPERKVTCPVCGSILGFHESEASMLTMNCGRMVCMVCSTIIDVNMLITEEVIPDWKEYEKEEI
jgi:hypothetical protein